MSTETLESRAWQRIIAVDDNHRANFGMIDLKRTRNVATVVKGLQKCTGGPLFNEDIYVDMWRNRVYREWLYVSNLCSFTDVGFVP